MEQEKETISEAVTHLLEECRMVLPGLQALFGFQLIAVFNSAFEQKLTEMEQVLHLTALGLVAIAVAFVMAPAAYHRQTRPRQSSDYFLVLGGRMLLVSMIPLMAAIALDFYLIARIILATRWLSALLAVSLAGLFIGLWFVLPRAAPPPDHAGASRPSSR
jgi:hypothetical protein